MKEKKSRIATCGFKQPSKTQYIEVTIRDMGTGNKPGKSSADLRNVAGSTKAEGPRYGLSWTKDLSKRV